MSDGCHDPAPGRRSVIIAGESELVSSGSAFSGFTALIVWCESCRHQVEPDAAKMAERYGAETTVSDWRERLVCSQCGSRKVDMW